ncbi:hypothetical protein PHPI107946_03495 [Phocicoccus pinnipedialis]|uniref:Uncharacterized protein n=1 Tax=Phocicoccus pinnipedialis TaxID=110845 RepID=A0A6V7R4J9_9BACL|nr:hypothetical protein [Jeotgalicoccus pinnipedialis]CAD2072301.1 hypothetical protein JEOPIN946_00399 [Jeotgalicoccus pinnipedialis]
MIASICFWLTNLFDAQIIYTLFIVGTVISIFCIILLKIKNKTHNISD